MSPYKSSIEALQQLLHLGIPYGEVSGKRENGIVDCQITKTSKDIFYMRNGIECCFIEVTCCDGTQYGLQAYGEEAKELYREAHRCVMCGGPPREPKRSVIVEETIEGKHYIFDSTRCALIFKKLVNVMGEETPILMTV
jgi:uncharacterized protein with PIN domain